MLLLYQKNIFCQLFFYKKIIIILFYLILDIYNYTFCQFIYNNIISYPQPSLLSYSLKIFYTFSTQIMKIML